MATIYLRSSDGSDGDDGSTWALAKATYQAALTAGGTDGIIYMDEDHRETFGASTTFTVPSGCKTVVCQTDTTTPVTAPNATANIETTSSNDLLKLSGTGYYEGFSCKCTSTFSVGLVGNTLRANNCRIETGSLLSPGEDGSTIIIKNSTLIITLAISIGRGGLVDVRNSTLSINGTNAISHTTEGGKVVLDGNDMSGGSFTNLIDSNVASGTERLDVMVSNCKFPASYNLDNGSSPSVDTCALKVTSCGNADEIYQDYERQRFGTIEDDTAIYRTGGASVDGTTGFSYKITTTSAAVEAILGVRFRLVTLQVDASTQKTLTVHLAYDDPSLNNDDVWIEAKYHDATDEALGKWASTGVDSIQDTPGRTAFTDVSGSETWNGTAKDNEESIELDITGADGLVEIWVNLAVASTTIYVDPKIEIS